MKVMELMRQPVRTVNANTLVTDAVRTLVAAQVSALPVLDAEQTIAPDSDVQEAAQTMLYLDVQRSFVVEAGKVVGVISQTDIVAAVAAARIS